MEAKNENINVESFKKIEEEIDALLCDQDGGTVSYSNTEFSVSSPTLPFNVSELLVKIDGTADLIKTRSIKGKEHRSYLNADIDSDDGSTETLFETYVADIFSWTDAQSIIDLMSSFIASSAPLSCGSPDEDDEDEQIRAFHDED